MLQYVLDIVERGELGIRGKLLDISSYKQQTIYMTMGAMFALSAPVTGNINNLIDALMGQDRFEFI